tara:strand:+ start:120 stop:1436 length:1317 start_codon:yes stop_codon:yes gene_type:complete
MASTYLTKTNSGTGSETKATFSAWIKISNFGDDNTIFREYESSGNYISIKLKSGGIEVYGQNNSSAFVNVKTTRVLRDFNAWYHVVVAIDSTQGTAANRIKIYINGVQETVLSSTTYPSSSLNCKINQNSEVQTIGGAGSSEYFDGSLSHVHWVDGTAYAASTFGSTDSTTGEWKINTSPSVTYGTNGFFILKDGNTITDSSPNSNNFSLGGGTLTKTEDCPSNVFATINPLYYSSTGLLNGNVTATSTGNSHKNYHSTIAVDSGKWYAEMKVNSWNGSNNIMFGIVADSWDNINKTSPGDNFAGNASTGIGYGSNGQKIIANSASSYGNSFTTGDILGIALDLTNNKLYFSKNGTYQNSGVPTSGATGTGAIDVPSGFTRLITFSHYGSQSCSMNFGNGYFGTTAVSSAGSNASGIGIFEYDTPTGYTALSTKGLNL